ncbi:sm-like protein LSM4 isoform X2 [Manihot esculenta]|uniref:U6 snRNA-associated Sm-like protein LSm4 n=1 Tax=Manihot esculenta TaxID=3983 RepID=A0A2C9VDB2_MANES|nr:sm-like protein LSM4 isoform X2 [Manihot esculenta]XP_043815964.1 sm-like protein LSM4 isoform X2 [Manihot esculenta]XP_043815965.1 sm-like protein LSM4 isoform X2 [Manihot esculenta]
MLPLSLLKTAQGHPMLVELKNGETYNGHLVNCDTWMNIHLREVICTSKDGDRFWRMPECYIRGNTIKYLRVPDEGQNIIFSGMMLLSQIRQRCAPQGNVFKACVSCSSRDMLMASCVTLSEH